MARYKLRTLLILLTVGPPVLGWWAWPAMERVFWPTIDGTIDFNKPLPIPGDADDGVMTMTPQR